MATHIVQMTDEAGNKQYPVTSSAAVGMSDGSGSIDNRIMGVGYTECSTAGYLAAKTLTINGVNLITRGIRLAVKMLEQNTAANATMNINNLGAKPLFYNNEQANNVNTWAAGEVVELYFDGSTFFCNNILGGNSNNGGNKILDWDTDVATTRKKVALKERKDGLQVSYKPTDSDYWINEQYNGKSFIDSEWIKDTNWKRLPDETQIDTLNSNILEVKSKNRNILDPSKIYYASNSSGQVKPSDTELGNACDIEIPIGQELLTIVSMMGYISALPQVDCFDGDKHLGYASKSDLSENTNNIIEKVATYTLLPNTNLVKVFTNLKGNQCQLNSTAVYLSDIREYHPYDTDINQKDDIEQFIISDKSLKIKLPQINAYNIKIKISLPSNYIYQTRIENEEGSTESSAKIYFRYGTSYAQMGDLKPVEFKTDNIAITLPTKSNEKQYFLVIECDNTAIAKGENEDINKLPAIPLIQTSKFIGRGMIGDGINAKPENYPVYGKGSNLYISDFFEVKGGTIYYFLGSFPQAEYDKDKIFIKKGSNLEQPFVGFYKLETQINTRYIVLQKYSTSDISNEVIPIIHFELPSVDVNTNRRFLGIVRNKALTLSFGDIVYNFPNISSVNGTFSIGDSIAARISSLVKGINWLATATYGGCTVDVYVADKFTRCTDQLTYEDIKGADVVISTGTNDQDYFKTYNDFAGRNLLALYSQLVTELRALGAKNIYCVGPFVGTSTITYDTYKELPVRTALKALFGGNFIDICEYMFELGLCFNPYHILPFIQPEVGGNVTITVDNADAFFGANPIMKQGADFYVQYSKLTPEGNAYDKYTVVSIDKAQSQAVVTLKENNSDVKPGDTGGYYTTSYTSPAISNVNKARYGWVYTEQDLTDVTQNRLPRSIGETNNSGDPHWNMLVAKHVENMLFLRGAISK